MVEPTLRTSRALVAHPAREVCHYLADLLAHQGYSTVEAEDGLTALQQIRQRSFDLALLDLLLPGLNALELLLETRTLSRRLPVIITGLLSTKSAAEAVRQQGAAGYLALPAGKEELAVAVREAGLGQPPDPLPAAGPSSVAAPVLPNRLTAAVARAFHRLLTVESGLGRILLGELRVDDPVWGIAEAMRRNLERAVVLAGGLLALVDGREPTPVRLNVNAVVTGLVLLLRELLRKDIELATALDPAPAPVRADPRQVELLLLHLALDAQDAMPWGGRLTVRTANIPAGPPAAARPLGLSPGRYVALEVSDTGTDGGPRREPLLALIAPVLRQLGGTAEVTVRPGQGGMRTIYLPSEADAADGGLNRRG